MLALEIALCVVEAPATRLRRVGLHLVRLVTL